MAAEDGASEELEEVEQELNKKQDDPQADDEEAGEKTPALTQKEADAASNKILMQAFTLTFLAEWGDRSQIATIALAAAREPFGVTLGGCIGHACCTAMAVVGGSSSRRPSPSGRCCSPAASASSSLRCSRCLGLATERRCLGLLCGGAPWRENRESVEIL